MENTVTLDREWIDLMKEARDQGFTKEEIVEFLKNPVAKLNEVYMQKIVNS
ncbi:anti-repressor SinI family protein [Bacillus sp. NEB1478]|uniref:anti-repressor SinI family protein n=1 Tax=Bacillus sp. NEB1478 TaxID=3073816 RepID=UPI002872FD51|nr:anti-repressor SinI family protein [Bacillus sp. NEB1478]WNB92441.1 anti-repressor SinI family protein [Bacillus sp. NEB1478]